MFEYTAQVVKVFDGDSITVDLDLGFGIWLKNQTIRLANINTPEIRGPERKQGLKARDFVRDMIDGRTIVVKTYKDSKGKYGRWLGEVFFSMGSVKMVNLNLLLIEKGMAKRYG